MGIIVVYANGRIGTINNYGTIKGGNDSGIRIVHGSTVDNITNHGVIEGNKGGIYAFRDSYIKTAINSSTGTIITHTESFNIDNHFFAIGVYGGYYGSPDADYLKNEGYILSAGAGMGGSYYAKKTIENIENSGTIVYNGKFENKWNETQGTGAGVYNFNVHSTLINNSGVMHVLNGIYLTDKTVVETILNSGTINAFTHGLRLQGSRVDTIKNTGTIIAGNHGIDVSNNTGTIILESDKSFVAGDSVGVGVYRTTDSIALKDGATIAAINFNEDRTAYTYDYEGTALLNK
ncbi:hypothetical protein L8U00_03835, partial [Campylobacter sp. IFREMER_LSEM_CL2256]